MTVRNPEEGPDETKRDKVLQAINEALDENTDMPAEGLGQNTPALDAPQEAALDTKVKLDRVETYLRGPTVFSA
ncbi:hypothetical protein [Microvirga sp. G4-2]|uniref:hypothetical protein n=1 Tax=Microvirga sp. G4-2 TaxID=3434467 RepID=UPI004044F206